jgi:LacI family transcriptional regulator
MASLADISRRAGVSIATASRVLNGSSHPVSDATRNRVLAAAEELGYRPSELARALVLLDYHAAGVVFAGSGYEHAEEAPALRDAVEALKAGGAAVVALAARDFDCPSVLVDNRGAARDATEHLLGLGHRRIAFVEGPPGLHTSAHRLEGFSEAMAAARAEPVRLPGGFEYEAGAAAAVKLLEGGALPDAVLGVNDEVAIGLLTGLRRAGVDVPGRLSVAGIDDTRPARLVDLTSVSLPLHELGERAARVILEGADGDVVLPHRLVARGTTAAR